MKPLTVVLFVFLFNSLALAARVKFKSVVRHNSGYFQVECSQVSEPEFISSNDLLSGNFCPHIQESNIENMNVDSDGRITVTCNDNRREHTDLTELSRQNVCLSEIASGKYSGTVRGRNAPDLLVFPTRNSVGTITSIRVFTVVNDEITREEYLKCQGFVCRGLRSGDVRPRPDCRLHPETGSGHLKERNDHCVQLTVKMIRANRLWFQAGFDSPNIYEKVRIKKVSSAADGL